MRINLCLAAIAATLVATTPAFAAPTFPSDTANATARGTVLQSHSLVNATALDFGIVTVDPVNSGTVSVSASASPVRTAGGAGGVTLLPSSFSAARFDGLAAPLENVVLTLTPPTGGYITDAANDTIAVSNMYVDQNNSPNRQANGSGNFTVYVGADFSLSAAQPSGVYSGTFQLTAQYE
ncbi:MAG TPA: DUF4402 domain-containing protein [Sphingomicrobium sp.]|nr:DUF4402 domain-containing protein [Sphingomicrobium sp.]